MSIAASIGSSALSGVLGNVIGNINGYNMWQAENHAWAIDPLGYGFGKILSGSEKLANKKAFKQAKKYAALQYQYQLRSAREMPAANRAGLEAAGYNPLLALGSTAGGSSAVDVPPGAFRHKDDFREVNPLLLSSLETAASERERVKAETTRTKVNTVTDILKTVISAGGAALLAKRFMGSSAASGKSWHKNVNDAKVIPLIKEPSKLQNALGAVAQAAIASSAATLPAASYAGAQYGIGKLIEKYGDPTVFDKGANKRELNHRVKGLGIFHKAKGSNRKHN